MTPALCTPVMSAAATCDARYGSSPYPSNARPPYGVRRMLTFGASEIWWPLAACSVPSAAPTDWTVLGSQVAASLVPSGNQVTPVLPLPAPTAPSARYRSGMPRAGMPWM